MKTLSCRGLTDKDQLVLRSLIDLMVSRTNERWALVDDATSSVVIVDTDNLKNSPEIIDEVESQHAVVIEYSSETTGKTRLRIHKPLRAANLITVLNSVDAGPSSKTDVAETHQSQADSLGDLQHGGKHLDLLSGQSSPHLKIAAGDSDCTIDLSGDRYLLNGDQPFETLLGSPDRELTPCADQEHADQSDARWRSDASLKWKLGLYLSDGALFENLSSRSRFKLLRWPPPDIPRAFPGVMTLSALFSRPSGATIGEALQEANVSITDTVGFINAAYLSRALSIRAFKPEELDPTRAGTERPVGLFSKIRDRLTRKS